MKFDPATLLRPATPPTRFLPRSRATSWLLGLALVCGLGLSSTASAQVRPASRVSASSVRSARQPMTVAHVRLGRATLQLACASRGRIPVAAGVWSRLFGAAANAPTARGLGCVLRRADGHALMLALPVRGRAGAVDFLLRSSGTPQALSVSVPTAGLVDTDFVFGLASGTGRSQLGGDDIFLTSGGRRAQPLSSANASMVMGLVDTDFVFGATAR